MHETDPNDRDQTPAETRPAGHSDAGRENAPVLRQITLSGTGDLVTYECPVCGEPDMQLFVMTADDGNFYVVTKVDTVLTAMAAMTEHFIKAHTLGIDPAARRTDTGETWDEFKSRKRNVN